MSDELIIVKAARNYADDIDNDLGIEMGLPDCLREAANLIERLTAQVDGLQDEIRRLREQVRFASETDPAMRAEAAEAERDRLAGEVDRLKRMLFPYAEDKEISGVTWNGFYLIGNKKSIDEFKRLENRAAQLETYRAEFVRRNEAAEAERDRLQLANARMKAALEEIADITQYLGVPTLNKIDDAFQRGLIAGHETCAHIARKALGGDAS